jgi:hypothetical protein
MMAKKSKGPRKPGGTAAIPVVEDDIEQGVAEDAPGAEEAHSQSEASPAAKKPARAPKAKSETSSNENIGVGDIKKAAAFANSVGGLDKAVSLLQILKVAKEVQ